MESTKQMLVRRSENMFYLGKTTSLSLNKLYAFRKNGTYITISDENIRFNGTWDGTENTSGIWGVITCLTGFFTMKANVTYTITTNPLYLGQFILQKRVDGTRVTVKQLPYGTHSATVTPTEDILITDFFLSLDGNSLPKNTPFDFTVDPMIIEGSIAKDYEPYYREYESTKEVLVRRSNNLFLPFSSYIDTSIGKDAKFTPDKTLFGTIETDGNIHIHGTKSVADSGWYLISNFISPLILKAGKTYSFKCNQPYGNCTLQTTVSGSRQTVMNKNIHSVTPTVDTPITHIYIDMYLTTKDESNIGKEYDFYINPMVVEGDTAQDYEPYYYEAEASKTDIIPDDGSLTSVVDFSNVIKGKRLNPNNGVTLQTNGAYAYVPDYFPCETGDVFKFTYVGQEKIKDQNYRQNQIMWYDVNKNFLSFEAKNAWSPITFSAAPANAKFFRINYSGLYLAKIEWMLPSNPKLTKVTS